MADLNTDVRYIKGIGEQRAKALGKLGIATLRDLISYFPRAYDDRSALRRIADLVPGETAGVAAMVASPPTISHIRKGLDLVKLRAVDDTGTLDVTFFNQAWLKNSLHQGETYIFYGRAEGSLLRHQMANPVVEPEGRREVTGRIVPIYPLTAGVSQLILSRSIRQGLDACADILPDVLPDRVRQHHQLCRIEYAYENIHFPESAEALDLARRRLAFEELFLFTIGLERLRSRREVVHVPPCGGVDMELFYRALPFTLTDAQRRCVEEALADMRSGTPMNRLCQGDVGSGKTMVAAACVYFMVKNGRQAALMAPTEILAQQHYQGLAPLLENLGIRCALLTGSTTAKTKRSITQQLESGEIDFTIGTHALITGSVAYRDLGLVVTDEQHRFGVAQRAELAAKGDHPHILVMSATPIPRTLALVISQSGETIDTLAAMREAKRLGARLLSIVNVVGSTIARESDDVLYTWAGPEIAVATTKAYSTQLAVIYLVGLYFAELLGRIGAQEYQELVAQLRLLPSKAEEILAHTQEIQYYASIYFNHDSVFFIGRNIDYAVGLEGSLKLKEISYIHSEAYAAGELKHGTISLIEDGTLVVALASWHTLFDKLMSNVKEVKARGADVIGISTASHREQLDALVDSAMTIPDIHPMFLPSLEVIPMQLFAYYVALMRGCDIDKPRNLAKSVTVE